MAVSTMTNGVRVMREFHSDEGIDENMNRLLESLSETASETLEKSWNEGDRKKFLMVILRSACQIGRHN